jgi:hypothetical protein
MVTDRRGGLRSGSLARDATRSRNTQDVSRTPARRTFAFVLFHQTIVKQMRAAKSPIATANPLDPPGVMSAAGGS